MRRDAAGRSAICTAIYYPGECITSYRAGWMAFTIRGILCITHTWPHIPRHGRRYLHPAETRPQNRRENMLKDFSRECQTLLPASSRSSSLSAPPTYSHYRERVGYNLKNVSSLLLAPFLAAPDNSTGRFFPPPLYLSRGFFRTWSTIVAVLSVVIF